MCLWLVLSYFVVAVIYLIFYFFVFIFLFDFYLVIRGNVVLSRAAPDFLGLRKNKNWLFTVKKKQEVSE